MLRRPQGPLRLFLMLALEATLIRTQTRGINCTVPPSISDGFHNGTGPSYPYGIVIKYSCYETFSLIGLNSIYCNFDGLWKGKPPICQVVKCEDPVVQHGIKLTGERVAYKYGSSVAFQCNAGYFMVGNYLIRCEKDSVWFPQVPSCKKLSPYICGVPVILNGNLKPLKPLYENGQQIIISCNQNYSFIDETTLMIIKCKGYNLWYPPIQPCFFTFPSETSQLFIYNGKIVQGRKRYYNPGDEVVIQCHAGYIMIGQSNIKYIGANKWFPSVPACHLMSLLPILILAVKMLHEQYSQKREARKKRKKKMISTDIAEQNSNQNSWLVSKEGE